MINPKTTEGRGGKRTGSGRKKLPPTKTIAFRVPENAPKDLLKLGRLYILHSKCIDDNLAGLTFDEAKEYNDLKMILSDILPIDV